ncbi:DUF2079 domain-containing protein [Candidatus Amarolinea aalborgensis]|uniref:DUF2079 domain-containing protein n=1 Tax=Candidatus Amarolinea aalborgensis TaxID=2249329 RepID=UPI003BF9DCCC
MTRLRPWLQAGVFVLALVFLGALIATQWRQLQAYPWQIQIGWLLLALALLWLTWLLELNQWRFILGRLGGSLRYGEAARIWFLSNIIRYIPGNVWQFLGMSEMAAQHGIPRAVTFTSIALHQAISTLAGLLLAAVYFGLAGHGAWFDRLRLALWLAPLGLIFLHPRVLEATLNRVLTWLKRPPLRITLTVSDLARLLLAYGLVWLGFGLGFSALVRGLAPVAWTQTPWLIAGYAAAYVLGYLSLLTPSGLGVREGVLILLLQVVFRAPLPAIIAIVARLWMVIGEIGGALAAAGWRWAQARRLSPDMSSRPSAAPLAAARRRLASDPARIAVLLAFLFYVVGFSVLSIRPHEALGTHMADLGQMDLAIWNTSQGRFVQEIKDDYVSTRLTDHVEPIFLPISLVFYVWNDVRALLILQTVALGSGALILFALARALLRPSTGGLAAWLPFVLALAYLLFPALQAANLAEFHAIPFAATPILLAFWCQQRRHWWGFVVACLLLLSVKEEAALLAFMLGLFVLSQVWLARRTQDDQAPNALAAHFRLPRLSAATAGLLVMLLSLGWFYLATFVIIPHYAAQVYGVQQSVYFARYGALGDSPLAIVKSFFTQPALVWRIATEAPRLAYLAGLLAPFGFLSLLAPEILLLSAPLLLANLFSAYPAQFSGEFHYSAPLIPYVALAAVIGVRRLLAVRAWTARAALVWLLVWAFACQLAAGYTPLGREFRWPEVTPHARLLSRFAAQVPAAAPGSVTTALYPHFSHREKLFKFPIIGEATWALVDVTGATDRHPAEIQAAVLNLVEKGWQVLDAADGYVLLQRTGRGSACARGADAAAFAQCALPDAFFDFARAARSGLLIAPPGRAAPLTFGDRLTMQGYDLVDDGKWGLTRWRSVWQAQAPLPLDLHVWPFAVAPDGSLADDPAQRPAVATLWYPPSRWQPGEVILVETLPWYLPDAWAPAVGVFQGDAWSDVARRWRVQGADTSFEQETWARLAAVRRRGRSLAPLADDQPTAAQTPPIAAWKTVAGAAWGDLQRIAGLPSTFTAQGVTITLPLTLTWQLAAPDAADVSAFVHLRDATGHNAAQADGQPVWFGPRPFSAWAPGQPGADRRNLELPAALAPGQYRLVLGIYNPVTGERLPLASGGDEAAVGTMTVRRSK